MNSRIQLLKSNVYAIFMQLNWILIPLRNRHIFICQMLCIMYGCETFISIHISNYTINIQALKFDIICKTEIAHYTAIMTFHFLLTELHWIRVYIYNLLWSFMRTGFPDIQFIILNQFLAHYQHNFIHIFKAKELNLLGILI